MKALKRFTRIFGAVAFLLGIVTVLLTFTVRPLHRAFIPLSLFVVWSFVGLLWSIDGERRKAEAVTYLLLLHVRLAHLAVCRYASRGSSG